MYNAARPVSGWIFTSGRSGGCHREIRNSSRPRRRDRYALASSATSDRRTNRRCERASRRRARRTRHACPPIRFHRRVSEPRVRQHRRLCRQRHVRTIGVPAFVADHHLHAVLVIREQRAIGASVADRHDLAVGHEVSMLPNRSANAVCAARRRCWPGKYQDRMFEKGGTDGGPFRRDEFG